MTADNASVRRNPRQMLRDVLLVAKGTALGQAPFVIASPFITRLYSPAELGIFGLAMAFVGIASPVAGLKFEMAAISVREPEDARRLLLLSALAIAPVTAVAGGLLSVFKITGVGSYDALSWVIVAVTAATIAASGVYTTLRSWCVRQFRFGLVANSLALQGTVRAALPLLLAPLSLGAILLMGAELIARFACVTLLAARAGLLAGLARLRTTPGWIRTTAVKYWKYPLLMAPSSLLDATATAIPLPIIASCYDIEVAGEFALAQRLVILPAALIASSVGDVFHAHAADANSAQPEAARALLVATARRLLLVAIAVYVPIAVLAPFTAQWIFGRSWAGAGALIAALTPLCAAQTVVSPLSRGLLLNNKEERKLVADLVCLILPGTTLYFASGLPIFQAVALFSAAAVVAFAFYFAVIITALQKSREP